MSNEKPTSRDVWKTPFNPAAGDDDTLAKGAKRPAKIVSLALDEHDDFGGDPYNHTGSHAVPDFGQDD